MALKLFVRVRQIVKKIQHFAIAFLRPRNPTDIIRAYIWSGTISVNNTKIILTQLILKIINASFLQLCFSIIGSTSTGSSIRLKWNIIVLSFSFEMNLRPFSNKILENLPYFWLASRLRLSKILNTNKKKYKIRFPICNTFNPSW